MSRNNKDRYGYRHRDDPAHDVGGASPGDVGDSEGTFHDRARQNENVIVDGQVRSIESHQRSSVEANSETTSANKSSSSGSSATEGLSQSEAEGKVVEVTIDSRGGTKDTIARYQNHQVHIEGGTPGETLRVRLESGQGYLIGQRIRTRE